MYITNPLGPNQHQINPYMALHVAISRVIMSVSLIPVFLYMDVLCCKEKRQQFSQSSQKIQVC